jgi:hypothetical protein
MCSDQVGNCPCRGDTAGDNTEGVPVPELRSCQASTAPTAEFSPIRHVDRPHSSKARIARYGGEQAHSGRPHRSMARPLIFPRDLIRCDVVGMGFDMGKRAVVATTEDEVAALSLAHVDQQIARIEWRTNGRLSSSLRKSSFKLPVWMEALRQKCHGIPALDRKRF